MHRFIAALLAVASCASIAQAQSADPTSTSPPLTLEQALSLAGATAPSLEAATAGVRAAEAGRTVAGYRPNPSIVAETENIAGSGQYRGLRSAETTAGLALPIELGGKRSARIAVADAIGNRARIGTALAEADLRLAVTQLYIEATAAERRLVTAREQAGIAREALARSRRPRSGGASITARTAARRCVAHQRGDGRGARRAACRGRARQSCPTDRPTRHRTAGLGVVRSRRGLWSGAADRDRRDAGAGRGPRGRDNGRGTGAACPLAAHSRRDAQRQRTPA